jgi:hypothetical protein
MLVNCIAARRPQDFGQRATYLDRIASFVLVLLVSTSFCMPGQPTCRRGTLSPTIWTLSARLRPESGSGRWRSKALCISGFWSAAGAV